MTSPAEQPSPLQPIGLGLADAMEQGARDWARKWKLIDRDGNLHCANPACRKVTEWHVSLHCLVCRVNERTERPERLRRERQEMLERQQQEQEQSRPQQRVGGRSFRDGY